MKKIRLDLEALDVVSFVTDEEPRAQRGTVRGRGTEPYYFTGPSCYGECVATNEYYTCNGDGSTQGPSCEEMCGAASVGCYPYTYTDLNWCP
jgi:hypothetical protein